MPTSCSRRFKRFRAGSFCTVLAMAIIGPRPLLAQAVVTAVNGEPITTFDVDEHVKLLKLTHKPAGRNDALESAVTDRLKYDEARKWGIDASDSDIQSALTTMANEARLKTDALAPAAQKAKIDTETIRFHLRALGAWDAYVRSRNKTLGVSEEEITAQLAIQGTRAKITDYDLRQVVFVVPLNAAAAVADERMKEAQALRSRFSDCGTGLSLARGLPDVAVKERMTRTSDSLTPALRTLLAETPAGHLTTPQRTQTGIEMVAVCTRSEDSDQTTLRDRVQTEVLNTKLQAESVRMYNELRQNAVLSKN